MLDPLYNDVAICYCRIDSWSGTVLYSDRQDTSPCWPKDRDKGVVRGRLVVYHASGSLEDLCQCLVWDSSIADRMEAVFMRYLYRYTTKA